MWKGHLSVCLSMESVFLKMVTNMPATVSGTLNWPVESVKSLLCGPENRLYIPSWVMQPLGPSHFRLSASVTTILSIMHIQALGTGHKEMSHVGS